MSRPPRGSLGLIEAGYRLLFRVCLSRLDPESAHHAAMLVIRTIGGVPPVARALGARTRAPSGSAVDALGLRFSSPFGLAAGFDKNAIGVRGLAALGFGHIEVGTVTALPQPGNPRPRLFRLPDDRALINRMGFNNDGAVAVARRIAALRRHGDLPVLGVNIGKSRVVDVADAVADYATSARLLAPLADYLVINVSSPNTPGLRGLQELDRLEPLLIAVRDVSGTTPLLVKIAPDLDDESVSRIAALATRCGLAGVVATNTTLRRDGLRTPRSRVAAMGAGGVSGPPLAARSLEIIRLLRAELPVRMCVIGVGGVETAEDLRAHLHAGATLVQGYTAFLYRGPGWAASLNRS